MLEKFKKAFQFKLKLSILAKLFTIIEIFCNELTFKKSREKRALILDGSNLMKHFFLRSMSLKAFQMYH